jgi:hypothetical protein
VVVVVAAMLVVAVVELEALEHPQEILEAVHLPNHP